MWHVDILCTVVHIHPCHVTPESNQIQKPAQTRRAHTSAQLRQTRPNSGPIARIIRIELNSIAACAQCAFNIIIYCRIATLLSITVPPPLFRDTTTTTTYGVLLP